jgi:hypothetical protein
MAGMANLGESFQQTPGLTVGNLLLTLYGCLTVAWNPTKASYVSFNNTMGALGCAGGFIQDVYDMDEYLADPTEQKYTTFEIDWAGSMVGCVVPLIAAFL